jgi:hydrogenase maturation protease
MNTKNKCLIIGIGNPIRGDDALGWRVIDYLAETIDQPDIQLLQVQQLTLDLVEPISEVNKVIFIDACIGDQQGFVETQYINSDSSLDSPITHFFDPNTLLSAVQALYGQHPEAILYTVQTRSFDFCSDLSVPVREAANLLTQQITEEISKSYSTSPA